MAKISGKAKSRKIVLTLDMGGSKTKAIVQEYPEGKPQVLLMDSEVADVARASVEGIDIEGIPESRAWVGVGGEYYVLGALARHQFRGISQLKELKYELAVPKICGAIWLAKEKLGLENDVSVYLNILLPPGETQDKVQLETRLKEVFRGFETPAGRMRVRMTYYNVASEGSGIFFHRRRTSGGAIPTSMFVMVGYRNASAFIVRGGVPSRGITSDLGMSWLVNNFVSKTSGLSPDNTSIVEVLVEAGASCDSQVLQKLSRKRKPDEIKADGESMSKALLLVRDEYWRAMARWLRSRMEDDVCELVFCGGTADYIRPEIDAYFEKEGTPISWHGDIAIPEIASSLGNRMTDVVALHEHMVLEFDRVTNYQRSQSLFDAPTVKPDSVADIEVKANTSTKFVPNYTPRPVPKEFLTMSDKI
ncbi:MAG: ParM/StbA family protein [Iphinoe sp. HA4291-MV1]|nr:ParM/StbA family protein [Iphinoe sp. HA4291-MV1]